MGESFSMILVMMLLSGGGTDLLDFMPTDSYWKVKGLTPTVQTLTADLAPPAEVGDITDLLKQLGDAEYEKREAAGRRIAAMGPGALPQLRKGIESPDAEVSERCKRLVLELTQGAKAGSVRRLMAIKTLGGMKEAEGLPALKALLDSKAPFEAEYAAAAIAAIEGKPFPRPKVSDADMEADLALLPRDAIAVGQVRLSAERVKPVEELLKAVPLEMFGMFMGGGMGGGGPAVPKREDLLLQIAEGLIKVSDRIGNMRLEGASVAVFSDATGDEGGAIILGRASYDPTAAAAALKELGLTVTVEDGVSVAALDGPEGHVALPSSDRVVLVAGSGTEVRKRLTETLAALKTGKGGLADNAEMAKLVKGVDRTKTVWTVIQMKDFMRTEEFFKPFESVAITADLKPEAIDFRAEAAGSDAKGLQASVDLANKEVAKGLKELKDMAKGIPDAMKPLFTPLVESLETVKLKVDGGKAVGTGQLKGGANSLVTLPFLMFSMAMSGLGAPIPDQP